MTDFPNWPELCQQLKGVPVYLIGMMGAGKSTIGKELAHHLNYRFVDTDETIEAVAGQSIPEIFAQHGESTFRDIETQVLEQLAPFSRTVISTGGGAVLRSHNWSFLHHGLIVWLDVNPTVLYQRLCADETHRPLLDTLDPQATLTKLLEQRRSRYAQADIHVPISDRSQSQALAAVAEHMHAKLQAAATERASRPSPQLPSQS